MGVLEFLLYLVIALIIGLWGVLFLIGKYDLPSKFEDDIKKDKKTKEEKK